jgi:hypothetical protein
MDNCILNESASLTVSNNRIVMGNGAGATMLGIGTFGNVSVMSASLLFLNNTVQNATTAFNPSMFSAVAFLGQLFLFNGTVTVSTLGSTIHGITAIAGVAFGGVELRSSSTLLLSECTMLAIGGTNASVLVATGNVTIAGASSFIFQASGGNARGRSPITGNNGRRFGTGRRRRRGCLSTCR